eukprot:jgi/Botrbrau1/16772/Bobra.150_2s0007.1
MQPAFPVPYKCLAADIGLNPTNFFFTTHPDHVLISVTQTGLFGNVFLVRPEVLFDQEPSFTVSCILGKRDDRFSALCANQIAQELFKRGVNRPLVISLGFLALDLHTVRAAVNQIADNDFWR